MQSFRLGSERLSGGLRGVSWRYVSTALRPLTSPHSNKARQALRCGMEAKLMLAIEC